jgi:UDP-N-acetylmuramyl pentapeptide phosphotransferase/UDP-N-acetylglucosamine-1-phosphate transferase
LFTVLVFIVIINAFNLIDGIDGLAGGIGFIGSVAFGSFFWYSNQLTWAAIAFAVAGALLAFLKFNFAPAKIFMGDGGSLLIGFLLSVMCVKFLATPILFDENQNLFLPAPVIALSILIVPLADMVRVSIIRILNKKSPFQADRNHVHHLLLNLGLNHKTAAVTLYIINILFIFGTLAFINFSLNYLFLIVVLNGYVLINIPKILLPVNKPEMEKGAFLNTQ